MPHPRCFEMAVTDYTVSKTKPTRLTSELQDKGMDPLKSRSSEDPGWGCLGFGVLFRVVELTLAVTF